MQLYDTNYVLAAEPLDPAFVGTLQEYFDHCVARLSIKSPTAPYNVIVSDSKPLSNQGLLLLGGTKVYVWDEDVPGYVPADIVDSLYAPGTGKAVFTVDGGVLSWKNPSDLLTWLAFGIGSLTPGAAGTIAYSNGTTNAWGIPETALPAKSVSIGKVKCEAADAGKFAQAQADGSVIWATTGSARGQVTSVESLTLPVAGEDVEITRPSGAVRLEAKLVATADNMFAGCVDASATPGNYGWTIGEEVDILAVDLESGSGGRVRAFNVIDGSAKWYVHRKSLIGGSGYLELARRDSSTGKVAYMDASKWKIVIRYL